MQGHPTYFTMHRFSLVRRGDNILRFGDGSLIEQSDHASLMRAAGLCLQIVTMHMSK